METGKIFILIAFSFLCLLGIMAQDSRPPSLNPPENNMRIRPRPTPPSCCRPFNSIGATRPQPIGQPPTTDSFIPPDIPSKHYYEYYRQDLESYRVEVERLRKNKSITKADYDVMITSYKIRLLEYKIAVYEFDLENLKKQ